MIEIEKESEDLYEDFGIYELEDGNWLDIVLV